MYSDFDHEMLDNIVDTLSTPLAYNPDLDLFNRQGGQAV